MKMNRLIGASLLSLLTLPMLGGCKKNKTLAPFVMPTEGYDGSSVNICFYETMGHSLEEVMAAYIPDFNELYPNIHVDYKNIGGYNDMRDQLRTQLGVGTDCTMTFCYPDHVALYNKTKKVVVLDDLMNDSNVGLTQAEHDDFIPAYLAEGQQFGDGKTYCLPFAKSTEVLYYDKTFFDNNSLTVPTTWDEMWTTCRAIQQINPTCTPLGYDSDANLFITMSEQLDCDYTSTSEPYFLFNNTKTQAMITDLKDKYDEKLFITKGLYGHYTSGLFTENTNTRCYMCIGSSAGASYQAPDQSRFEVGIASIPQADKTNHPAVVSQGPSVCLFNNEDPQVVVASWLFLKFLLTNIGFQAEYSMTSGYTPVINSVMSDPIYTAFLETANGYDNLQAMSVQQCLAQKDLYFSSPVFVGSATARDQVGDALDAVLLGNKTVAKALEDAKNECDWSI